PASKEMTAESVTVSEVSSKSFKVNVKGVKAGQYGVAAIFIPVWSEAQGQGSTIWHEATRQSDGSYTATIRTSDHGNSSGKYTVLAYGMDTQSQLTGLGSTSVEVPASKEMTAESVTVSEVSSKSFKVNVKGVKAGQYGVAAIFIPVWSEAQGQGSTIWHEATRQSDGSYTATIRTSDHGNSSGKYTVLAYGMDTQSQLTGLGST
ncbi:GBS Bsp-like repeat-containing protein, partial [Eubacterium limosum]|uniref:GBS Bsp-like repeat-containing protein n=1 Tax=Eubacterium limosum TaxID=1736 RepID=UPI001D07BB97